MRSIWLADKDCTADILPRLERAAAARPPSLAEEAARQAPVADLRTAPDEAAQWDRWLAVLRAHGAVRLTEVEIPGRSGFAGRLMQRIKTTLWRLLRYQHEQVAVRQNAVNLQILAALEAERREHEGELRKLRERIAALEARRDPAAGEMP
ncbi:MAG: hypothetical protein R6X19_08950 [Kiritimatiellia bacterium]